MKRKLKKALNDQFMRNFLGKSLFAFVVKIGSAGLSFLMFVVLARAMGQDEYGVFGAAFSLATFLGVVGSLGQKPVVLRFAGHYIANSEHEFRRGVTQRGYYLVLIGCLSTASITGVYYAYAGNEISIGFMASVVLLTVVMGVAEFQSFVLRVTAGIGLTLVPRDIIWRLIVCAVAGFSIAHLGERSLGAQHWLWVLALTLLLIVLVQFIVHESISCTQKILGSSRREANVWNQPMLSLWFSSIIMTGASALGVVMVERMISPQDAGPFFSAMRTAQLLNLLLFASSIICGPTLTRMIANNDWQQVQKICLLTSIIAGGFGVAGYLILVFLAGPILELFGPGFASARPELLIIGSGFVINTLAGPTGPLLEMAGKERAYFHFLLIFNGIGLLSMPATIFLFGTIGAAASTAFASISWNVAAIIYARTKLGVDPSVLALVGRPSRC